MTFGAGVFTEVERFAVAIDCAIHVLDLHSASFNAVYWHFKAPCRVPIGYSTVRINTVQ